MCLLFSYSRSQATGDLLPALHEVLGAVIEHLRASVCRRLRPPFRLAGCLDCIANVLAIPERRFAEQHTILSADFHAVAGVRARLLSPDV